MTSRPPCNLIPVAGLPDARLVIRPLSRSDLVSVSYLHTQLFPDYTLSRLGVPFLELYYLQYLHQPSAFCYVALLEDRLVGVVAGSSDPERLYQQLYAHHGGTLIRLVSLRLLRNPGLGKDIFIRRKHVRNGLRAVGRSLGLRFAPSAIGAYNEVKTRLLCLGVHPDYFGQGIAQELVNTFCQRCHAEGIAEVGLSVHLDNPRAIAFYRKTGWQQQSQTATSLYFRRSTSL